MKPTAIQIAQKNELAFLIRKISALNGGDDKKFLEEYIENVTQANFKRIGETLSYFKDLRSGSEKYLTGDQKNEVLIHVCIECGKMKPFCPDSQINS